MSVELQVHVADVHRIFVQIIHVFRRELNTTK